MSRISYILLDSSYEIMDMILDGGDVSFYFPDGTEGYLCIGSKKHRLASSEITIPLSSIENGINTSRLITADGEFPLPVFKKDDRLISFPEEENAGRKVSLKLARICCRLREIEKKLSELENFVRGTTCF